MSRQFIFNFSLDKNKNPCYNTRVAGGIPAQRLVDNLWITRCVTDRLRFSTSLFHSGAGATTSLGHFSTLAQENAVFVNANRYENDSHSGFFLWAKKILPFDRISRNIQLGLIMKNGLASSI